MTKVIVAGSRSFDSYDLLKEKLDMLEISEIVSGGARGADSLGEKYALENNIPIKLFPANWNQYGKSAGFIRNREMAQYADFLIVFWDGESKGTKHMIDLMKKENKNGTVVIF